MTHMMHTARHLYPQIHTFVADEELRLVVCGYIRPEQNFQGLDALIKRIHEDGHVSEQVLDMEPFTDIQNDSFLKPSWH